MSQMLTFTKVFTASGEKNGKPWMRWDWKTGDDTKYSTFDDLTGQITLGQPVNVEIELVQNGQYTNRTITAVLPAGGQQATGSLPEALQPVRSEMVASQGHPAPVEGPGRPQGTSDDAKGKTRAIYAAQMGVALFNSLPADEQTMEAAKQIMDALVDYAFQS